jgi:hypothetical protein
MDRRPAVVRSELLRLGARRGSGSAAGPKAGKTAPTRMRLKDGLLVRTLKICASYPELADRPTELATKEGSKSRLLVLKREAKD